MTDFEKELIDGIEEIAIEKGMSVRQAIEEALELCRRKEGEVYEPKVDRRTVS